jgi:hypothetical protein
MMVLVFVSMAIITQAQTFDEWFNQKATQKKYLIQQIAALKVYIGYLQKGYNIAKSGLNTIGSIKNGHFTLDKGFFASLHNINPKIMRYTRIGDIVALNIQIVQATKRTIKDAKGRLSLTGDEINYITGVFEKLVERCTNLTDELITVMTDGKLQMSDDQRIKRIEGIYCEMRDRSVFAKSFDSELRVLSLQRGKEQKELNNVRSLYGN